MAYEKFFCHFTLLIVNCLAGTHTSLVKPSVAFAGTHTSLVKPSVAFAGTHTSLVKPSAAFAGTHTSLVKPSAAFAGTLDDGKMIRVSWLHRKLL